MSTQVTISCSRIRQHPDTEAFFLLVYRDHVLIHREHADDREHADSIGVSILRDVRCGRGQYWLSKAALVEGSVSR
jgi:hypothetical protein